MTSLFLPRDAIADDYERFVPLFRELGEEPVPSRDAWCATKMPRTFFLERDGIAVAYALLDVLESTGYVRQIVVDPSVRRGGIGRALMNAIAERLRARGCTRWCLNVREDNVAARALYERVGMATAYESVGFDFPWAFVDRLPETETPVDVEEPRSQDDASIETRFDLPHGMLAGFRTTPGQLLFVLRDRDTRAVEAFTRFAPGSPRAFPFRVVRPDLARALLEGLRPHARPEHEGLTITVEDDPALVRVIEATGARVTKRMLHLRGEVPG